MMCYYLNVQFQGQKVNVHIRTHTYLLTYLLHGAESFLRR